VLGDGAVDQGADEVFLARVPDQGDGRPAGLADLAGGLLGGVELVGDDQPGPLAGEQQGGRPADA